MGDWYNYIPGVSTVTDTTDAIGELGQGHLGNALGDLAAGAVTGYGDYGQGDGVKKLVSGAVDGGETDYNKSMKSLSDQALANGQKEQDFLVNGGNVANQKFDGVNAYYANMYGKNGTMMHGGVGEQAYDDYASQFSKPTEAEDRYGQQGRQLRQDGTGEQAGASVRQALGKQGQGEAYALAGAGQLGGQGIGESVNSNLAGQMGNRSNAEQLYSQHGDAYNNNSQTEDVYGRQAQDFQGPGQLEQFAASDLSGSNPYYQQLQKTQSAQIDQSMNARGAYNSGAALAAQALGNSNLAAQQYQQEGQLQGQAQNARFARLGQEENMAHQTFNDQQTRMQNQLQYGQSADAGQLARANAASGFASNSQNSLQGRLGLQANLGKQGQDLEYQRLTGQLAAGQQQQTDAQGRLAQDMGNAQHIDAFGEQRLNDHLSAANGAQGLDYNRQIGGLTAGTALANAQAGITHTSYQDAGTVYSGALAASLGYQQKQADQQYGSAQDKQKLLVGGIEKAAGL